MSARKRQKSGNRHSRIAPDPDKTITQEKKVPQQTAMPASDFPRTGWRLWLMRLALVLVGPLTFALLAEGALRLCGYGVRPAFLISVPGGGFTSNDLFARQYFGPGTVLKPVAFTLPEKKAPGSIRICVLGESAAMGTPDPAFGFGRLIELQLRHQYPEKKIEVINAAMRGINSYIIRKIAGDCSKHEVDLFVIYTGNNEANGFHSPDPGSATWRQWLPLIRLGDWLRATRLGQLWMSLLGSKANLDEKQDMDFFRAHRSAADNIRRLKLVENFRINLADICQASTTAGAKVILSTVAVNLADCPPLGSLHRDGLTPDALAQWKTTVMEGEVLEVAGQHRRAIEKYLTAAATDDHFAELHFRLARCHRALGDAASAQHEYQLACDWDALQFRTDSRINDVIRNCAAKRQQKGVFMVDTEKAFARHPLSQLGSPGAKLFHDHVHPTFAGNYDLATNYLPAIRESLGPILAAPATTSVLDETRCAEALAFTKYEEINILAAMVRLTASGPFLDQLDHPTTQAAAEADVQKRLAGFTRQDIDTCLKIHETAVQRDPDDWLLRFNLASLLMEIGRNGEAVGNLKKVVEAFPDRTSFRINLAAAMLKQGDRAGARSQLEEARRIDPQDKHLRRALEGLIKSDTGNKAPQSKSGHSAALRGFHYYEFPQKSFTSRPCMIPQNSSFSQGRFCRCMIRLQS